MKFVGVFSKTTQLEYIRKLARLRVVDNSMIGRAAELAGKPAKCIQVYRKTHFGELGDKVYLYFVYFVSAVCLLIVCVT